MHLIRYGQHFKPHRLSWVWYQIKVKGCTRQEFVDPFLGYIHNLVVQPNVLCLHEL